MSIPEHLLRPRPAAQIMRPEYFAAMQPSRLSASRALINTLIRSGWTIERIVWDIDDIGRGTAVYRVYAGDRVFDLVALSFEPQTEGRTARIIGRNWDMMGALLEGPISDAALEQTRQELPKLYEGRAPEGTLIWARANRSMRLFEHVVDSLAEHRQPDIHRLAEAGYILRNTGLDGNGTFGTKSFLAYEDDHPLRLPYYAQMLASYLLREFGFDLAEHLAVVRAPGAVALDPRIKRYLGLGNGSGLGLILWVHNHPRLVSKWIEIRERAIVTASLLSTGTVAEASDELDWLLRRAAQHRREDQTTYDAFESSESVAADLERIADALGDALRDAGANGLPLALLRERMEGVVSAAALETLHSLMIELVPDADALLEEMVVSEVLVRDPAQPVGELRRLIEDQYGWALDLASAAQPEDPQVLYKSRAAEEPRRGPRSEAPHAIDLALHLPTAIAGIHAELTPFDDGRPVADYLIAHPARRQVVERIQSLSGDPYATPLLELLGTSTNPVHIIGLVNVPFFGLDRTKDHLRRTLRGVLFHGAPTWSDLGGTDDEHWFWPAEPAEGAA
ncbi:hypothetical protein [Agromyces aerolatus]|uniref:hypothetical protein n=1 Tax=Agromyces sp. LY-1074 TaxID=3074080 RepID=UPI00285B5595|nr:MULTISPECIES: hypothetical protein [unclassified Agromyces]MDR5701368.1 hypothetical protein [Agromyces sp. LY-1074]MDR5706843.1 hypothetical protein [Agromyces sp. LY-1358]